MRCRVVSLPGSLYLLGLILILGIAATPSAAQCPEITTTLDGNDGECAVDCTLREAIDTAADGCKIVVPLGTYTLDPALGPLELVRAVTVAGEPVVSAGDRPRIEVADGPQLDPPAIFVIAGERPDLQMTIRGLRLKPPVSADGIRVSDQAAPGTLISVIWVAANDGIGPTAILRILGAGHDVQMARSLGSISAVAGNVLDIDQHAVPIGFVETASATRIDQLVIWLSPGACVTSTTELVITSGDIRNCGTAGIGILGGTAELHDVQIRNSGLDPALSLGLGALTVANATVTATNLEIMDNLLPGVLVYPPCSIFGLPCGPTAGSLELRDSSILRNRGDFGAGLRVVGDLGFGSAAGGSALVERTLIADNVAEQFGGGVAVTGSFDTLVRLDVKDSTISGNHAPMGGGGLLAIGNAFLDNVTISGNTTSGDGGGIYREGSTPGAFTWLNHVTVINNEATTGGGIAGGVAMSNSVIAENTATISPDCTAVISEGYNLVGDASSCNGLGAVGDQIGVPPLLEPLQLNGGATPTHYPSISSPVLGGGAPPLAGSCLPTDQRGIPRPLGTGCDIGAVERDEGVPPVPDGTGGSPSVLLGRRDKPSFTRWITVQWTDACSVEPAKLIYGPLDDVANYTVSGALCGPLFDGEVQIPPELQPEGSAWFLVLRDDQNGIESSWGTASDGSERNGTLSSGTCGASSKDLIATCP